MNLRQEQRRQLPGLLLVLQLTSVGIHLVLAWRPVIADWWFLQSVIVACHTSFQCYLQTRQQQRQLPSLLLLGGGSPLMHRLGEVVQWASRFVACLLVCWCMCVCIHVQICMLKLIYVQVCVEFPTSRSIAVYLRRKLVSAIRLC